MKKISFITVILIFSIFFISANKKHNTIINDNALIDSLIVVKQINEKVIIVSFGPDAVTAIHSSEGIILIDAGISTGLTLKYRKIIENTFKSKNFKYLINTHFHPDHYGGNRVFEEAEVIGHENGMHEILEQWKDTLKVMHRLSEIVNEYDRKLKEYPANSNDWYETYAQKTRYFYALDDVKKRIKIKQPDIRFKDSLRIDVGKIKVEMMYFGSCHSNSDIFIFIPELKILFSGDLFFKYGRPSIIQEPEYAQWKIATKWLENRIDNIDNIISGHGEVLSTEDLQGFLATIHEKDSNK